MTNSPHILTHKSGQTFELTQDLTGEVVGVKGGWLVQEFEMCGPHKITAGKANFGRPTYVAALIEIEMMIERERQTLAKHPYYAVTERERLIAKHFPKQEWLGVSDLNAR